jgi:thiosulfate/3-mercaptopyruvate sulfurtransferase
MSYKTIISAKDLLININNKDFVIFDCRCDIKDSKFGIQSYTEGHIENAIFVDTDMDLSSEKTQFSGRHPLPEPNILSEKLSQWGLSNSKQAVVYDDVGGAFAGRMWWILKWLGHKNVAVLDGGLSAWLKVGGKLVTKGTLFEKGAFIPEVNNSMQVFIDDIEDAQYKMNKLIIDARSKERYLGIKDPVDPIAGHIPGAISHPLGQNLTKEGVFKSPEELKHLYFKILSDIDGSNVISMCGSGVTACHNILAMEIAGIYGVKLYVGSWSEWIAKPDRPIVTIDS